MTTRVIAQYQDDGIDYYVKAGVSNAQTVIQTAINASSAGDVVFLRGPATYIINDHIWMKSGVTLMGESASLVTIKLAGGLPNYLDGKNTTSKEWGYHGATGVNCRAMIMVSGLDHVTISNMRIDGSCDDLYKYILPRLGTSLFNMITAYNSTYLRFNMLSFTQGANDAIQTTGCGYVDMDACTVNRCGHDGLQAYNCNHVLVRNCKFINRTNSSVRFNKVDVAEFYNNDCMCGPQGGALNAVELQGVQTTTYIHHNVMHNLNAPAIGEITSSSPPSFSDSLKIYNNIIYKCPTGMSLKATGAQIYNNIIDECTVGIDCSSKTTTIDKCIITNKGKTGTGILMGAATTATNSYFFGLKTNVNRTFSTTNKIVDPKYTNRSLRNYTLPSTNPLGSEIIGIGASITPQLITVDW